MTFVPLTTEYYEQLLRNYMGKLGMEIDKGDDGTLVFRCRLASDWPNSVPMDDLVEIHPFHPHPNPEDYVNGDALEELAKNGTPADARAFNMDELLGRHERRRATAEEDPVNAVEAQRELDKVNQQFSRSVDHGLPAVEGYEAPNGSN